jgi:large subunit ribosomal protein L30
MSKFLLVELKYSGIARDQRQKDTLRGLGLRHRHQLRVLQDTDAVRGMIQKVYDLVTFREVNSQKLPKAPAVETYRLGPVPTERKEKAKRVHKEVSHEQKEEAVKKASPHKAEKKAAKPHKAAASGKAHAAKAKKTK